MHTSISGIFWLHWILDGVLFVVISAVSALAGSLELRSEYKKLLVTKLLLSNKKFNKSYNTMKCINYTQNLDVLEMYN